MTEKNARKIYLERLAGSMWDFAQEHFEGQPDLFDNAKRSKSRPPVFTPTNEQQNLLFPPDASPPLRNTIISCLPVGERHKYFRSMRSSQALAQSVFGALKVLGKLPLLETLVAEEGLSAFDVGLETDSMVLEHSATQFLEPRPTSIDVWFPGEYKVAVECKFSEADFGQCSRPNLKAGADKNFESDHCDGSYSFQRNRGTRCSLTEIGVRYWDYLPELFEWPALEEHHPCPLRATYQLARNILTACVADDGELKLEQGHALIIYDARNPSFCQGDFAYQQWAKAKQALKDKTRLRRCSWQRLIAHICQDPELKWLVADLRNKYGLHANT